MRPPPSRIVRHRSELGRWESVFRAPEPRLRPFVDGDYQGWVEETTSFARRREVPTTIVPLILNLGSPFRVIGPGETSGRALGSFAAGLHDGATLVEATGPSIGLQVNLTPIGASMVFGPALADLANRSVGLADILGATARRLESRLADTSDWDTRFAIVDRFLAGRVADARHPSPGVVHAWGRLERSDGRVAIGDLAEDLGWSHRHLITRFRDELGLAPKRLARVLRFRRALRLLEAPGAVRWASIALDSGYCDQSHLIREFHALAGIRPGEYLGRLLPDGGGLVGD